MKKLLCIFTSIVLLSSVTGCASKTADIKPKKVEDKKSELFNKYSCEKIDSSLQSIEKKIEEITKLQDENAKYDKKLANYSWFYGLPLLFLKGDGDEKKELEVILGEKESLEAFGTQKDCKFN